MPTQIFPGLLIKSEQLPFETEEGREKGKKKNGNNPPDLLNRKPFAAPLKP